MTGLRAAWHCPLCGHENVDYNANERDDRSLSYCDDAQDNGCGEGPFMIRTVCHQDAYLIEDQGYPTTVAERIKSTNVVLLNNTQVERKLGLGSTIALTKLVNATPAFPPHILVGGNPDKPPKPEHRRWREHEIDTWIASRFDEAP